MHFTKGGTERTTITIATALTRFYGAQCYSVYEEYAETPKESCFVEEFFWAPSKNDDRNTQALKSIIESNHIDCVVVQGAFIQISRFRAALQGLDCKLVMAHHFEPGWELVFGSFANIVKRRPSSIIDCGRWIKTVLAYPLTAMRREKQLSVAYRAAYEGADRVVLLCRGFIKPFRDFAGVKDTSKFVVIPNGLSFNVMPRFDKHSKQKVVLIVARLDESSKRLSLALRIWARVKSDPEARAWRLRVVGDGRDRKLYENIIRDERIPDVSFEGRRDPVPYYEEASIFMMTSKSESWGLTLTEAQQMGVVPIAFDTYASLPEIITDGENGVVVPEGDIDTYICRMKELIMDVDLRHSMAAQAMLSSQRFSPERIAKMWWDLLARI